ncbi:MAG: hypothetical protein HC882_01145 [Acidobacteria bacterium]|nr:hypothetical protein [Acidobacteriota bacterium]
MTLVTVLALSVATPCTLTPEALCERVSQVRLIPFKGLGTDEAYLALMNAGEAVVPCLIEKIIDTTPMPDPRMAPKYPGTVVGDIAFFILLEITGTELEGLLPETVRESFRVNGVYAYFDYVANSDNRVQLQQRCRDWWRQRKSRGERNGED